MGTNRQISMGANCHIRNCQMNMGPKCQINMGANCQINMSPKCQINMGPKCHINVYKGGKVILSWGRMSNQCRSKMRF